MGIPADPTALHNLKREWERERESEQADLFPNNVALCTYASEITEGKGGRNKLPTMLSGTLYVNRK